MGKLHLVMLGIALVVLGIAVETMNKSDAKRERKFQASLTPARRAAIDEFAKELPTLGPGDILEVSDGYLVVAGVDSDGRVVRVSSIVEAMPRPVRIQARGVVHIYRKSDPRWQVAAKKFLEQNQH